MKAEMGQDLYGLHLSFAATELGRKLESGVRYGKYKPEDVSNQRWKELLGADVNNLHHLPLTYGITKSMVRHLRVDEPGYLDEHEEQVLMTIALIHDWAESITGDIDYNDRTDEDRAEEERVLAGILCNHFDGDTSELSELVMEASELLHDEESKLGKLFNTIEKLGYLRTGLKAAYRVETGQAEECDNALRWLTVDVFGNQLEALIERAETYSPVKTYLKNQAPVINSAFDQTQSRTFLNYDTLDKVMDKSAAFHKALKLWVEFEDAAQPKAN